MFPLHVPSKVYAISASSSHEVKVIAINAMKAIVNIDVNFFIILLFKLVVDLFSTAKIGLYFHSANSKTHIHRYVFPIVQGKIPKISIIIALCCLDYN